MVALSEIQDQENSEENTQTFDIEEGSETVCLRLRAGSKSSRKVKVILSSDSFEGGNQFSDEHTFFVPEKGRGLKEKRPEFPHQWGKGSLKTRIMNVEFEDFLFLTALIIYLVTRLIGLDDYPIYFFTDEAIQANLAADFIRDGLRSAMGEWLPTYFYNSYQYNLSFSVYLQILPYLIFGKSIWVTRGASVLITLFAGLFVGLTLKKVFKLPHAWIGILLLSITPAWFLHSRTAFETSLATTFFAAFIFYYSLYRTDKVKYLYFAVISAALMFYSYSPARMVIGLTAVFLLLIDFGYHWKNKVIVLKGFGLTLLSAIPFIRFLILHPNENVQHMTVLNSYWIRENTVLGKLTIFFKEYLRGLDPAYWFKAHIHDLARHQMDGYGHMLWIMLPFILIGLIYCFKHFGKPQNRILIVSLIAAPSGAALVKIGITRALAMVIPASLLGAIGLIVLIRWLQDHWNIPAKLAGVFFFVLIGSFNVYLLRDALVNGPLWTQDYGLGGMQYGGKQLFSRVDELVEEFPDSRVIISPSWANGTDNIARFFFEEPLPFEMGSVEGFLYDKQELDDHTLFIMIPEEFDQIKESHKFKDIKIEEVLKHPNGEVGFYFVRLKYVNNIDDILQAERDERRILREEDLMIMDAPATVRYSYLDMGSIFDAFDGDKASIIRTMEANPLQLQIKFSEHKYLQSTELKIGGTATNVNVVLYLDNSELIEFEEQWEESPNPRMVMINFDEGYLVNSVFIEVRNIYDDEPAHVHLWEVILD
ncbi:MAG: glycosyltransferase family 39 protein [Anaerolineaceae bacterium]|nr:glycosyltransferase family 39 protein [Anaerolineaceae bacterium]